MAYTPLDETLLRSTLLKEGPVVVATFTLILASRDRYGETDLTPSAVAGLMRITEAEAERAFEVLSSPDPKSRNREHEGRRIIPTEDGRWQIVSSEKYQRRASREAAAERQRRHRARLKEAKVQVCAVCDGPGSIAAFGGYFCEEHAGRVRVATGVSTGGELPEGVMPPEEGA